MALKMVRQIAKGGTPMKTTVIHTVSVWMIIFMFAVMWFPLTTIGASGPLGGTVLSVIGEALFKSNDSQTWAPIKKGDVVQEGTIVKTGAKSLIRILAPDGTMIKVPADNETTITFAQPKETKTDESNISTFVAEFFSANQRTRINAVRSLVDPLQQDWIAFCNFDRLTPDKIEMGLELSAAYQNENILNRSTFILWKLSDLFPDNSGLKKLASQAIRQHPNSGKWEISATTKGVTTPADKTVVLSSGDVVTVKYRNPVESYVYLYKTSKNSDHTVKTEQIFPKTVDVMALNTDVSYSSSTNLQGFRNEDLNFASRIAPQETLFAKEDKVSVTKAPESFSEEVVNLKKGQIVEVLEEKGRRYFVKLDNDIKGWVLKHKLTSESVATGTKSGDPLLVMTADDTPGTTYIWGWSSLGPLSYRHIMQAISKMEQLLSSANIEPDESLLKESLPEVCGAFTIVKLVRQ